MLEAQIYTVLADEHPQSVRHVFYRMTDPRLTTPVDKTESGYRQVQDRISKMRERGVLPYEWISDSTRMGYHTSTFRDAAEYLRAMQSNYRGELWLDSRYYVEVWVESRSLAGVVRDICQEYAVSLYPAGGFSSKTLAFEAAQQIRWYIDEGKRPQILYIGDYDKAGVLIDVALERELLKHLCAGKDAFEVFTEGLAAGKDPMESMIDSVLHSAPGVSVGGRSLLDFHRIAINEDQIEEYSLPTKPPKAGDRRSRHINVAVEAEAMPSGIMRQMLTNWIESFLPEDALEKVKVAEESERSMIDLVALALDGDEESRDELRQVLEE